MAWERTRRDALKTRCRKFQAPMPEFPIYPGIRNALRQNKDIFTEWRYAHEHDALFAETGVLKAALKAIVDAYFVEMPSERRLQGLGLYGHGLRERGVDPLPTKRVSTSACGRLADPRSGRLARLPGRFAVSMHPSGRVSYPAAERIPEGSGHCRTRSALFPTSLEDRSKPYSDRERDRQPTAQDRNHEPNRSHAYPIIRFGGIYGSIG